MAFAYTLHPGKHIDPLQRPLRKRRAAEYFVAFEVFCQVALLLPIFEAKHGLLRASAFGVSLLLLSLAVIHGRRHRHPASRAAFLVLIVMILSVLNPMRNSWMSALAQLAIYTALLAPLFWVPDMKLDDRAWCRVLLLLWIFHTLSSATGILQVYFPGRFQPHLSYAYAGKGLSSLMITTNTGEMVLRPTGLTDVPGGAAGAGLYAISIGLLLFVRENRLWFRAVLAASMAVGLAVIVLSQVRTTLVMSAVCVIAFLFLLQLRNLRLWGRRTFFGQRITRVRLALATVAIVGMLLLGCTLAVSLANKSVMGRMMTLFDENPGKVYYSNRGHFLAHTFNDLLPEYPLGAGPGRWGMMYSYFGDPSNLNSPPIWSEIQWTGWLLDGGIPLILAYVYAIALSLGFALKIALGKTDSALGAFGAFMFAYDLGAFSQTFGNDFFISQGGLEFWFMNALLYATAFEWSRREARRLLS